MKTAADYESDLGLPVGTARVVSDSAGDRVFDSAGVEVPLGCSLWSLRCICTRRGLDAQIETGMASLGANPQGVARAMWNFSGEKLTRSDWLVKKLRVWIGYSNRQMDALFASALELEAAR